MTFYHLKKWFPLFILVLSFNSYSQGKIVNGGQFKDFFLPMPIHGELEKTNIWGGTNVIPRDVENGIESNEWSYWGGNPMLGEDGKYHISVARWKESKGHWGWPNSEVAHVISDKPEGPYLYTHTVLKKGHNPEIIKIKNNSYILHVSGGLIYTSNHIAGPWTLKGKIEIDKQGYKGISHLYTNITGVIRNDKSILFFSKRGDIMISTTGILGPYKIIKAHNYIRYSGYPEDPVIWKSRHQYHVIFNIAADKKPIHMRSLDGVNWINESGMAYDSTIFKYTDGTQTNWHKFERPKVLQDKQGRASHLSLAVLDFPKRQDLGNDIHSSKNVIIPLIKEKIINIIPQNKSAKTINLRIKSEKGFNPVKEIDVKTLRLGHFRQVNYGKGSKAIRSKSEGTDLIITFLKKDLGLTNTTYDLKLLGKTANHKLIYGYALLPDKNPDAAVLTTSPIIEQKNETQHLLKTSIGNYGLTKSAPCSLEIIAYNNEKRTVLKQFKIPSLESYEELTLQVSLDNSKIKKQHFEAIIITSKKEIPVWNKLDNNHSSVSYKGKWSEGSNSNPKDRYMGTEKTSSNKGDSVLFSFNSTQAQCYGSIGKSTGIADVFIDGKYIETIDCYFKKTFPNTVIYQTEVLSKGNHTLELKVKGGENKKEKGTTIAIDAFSYKSLY